MSEEELTTFIGKQILEITEKQAIITSKIEDTILNTWKINKEDVLEAINFKQDLIKCLEDKIEEKEHLIFRQEQLGILTSERKKIILEEMKPYQEILDKVKEV